MAAVQRQMPRWSDVAPLLRLRAPSLDRTAGRLRAAASVADVRMLAWRRTPRAVFDYTDGAAGTEASLRRSRGAFARVELRPRVLRDVSEVDLTTTVLGMPSAAPFAFAPTGFTRMMNHEGEPAVARVAEREGIVYALSTMGTTSLEALAGAAPSGRRWFQLYLWRDREASADLVRRARSGRLRGAGAHGGHPGRRAAAARRPQRADDPAVAHAEDVGGHGGPPDVVGEPADDAAAGVREPAVLGRHGERPRVPDLRPGRDRRRRRVAAPGVAGQAGRQGRSSAPTTRGPSSTPGRTPSSSPTTAADSSTAPRCRSRCCRPSSRRWATGPRCTSTAGCSAARTSSRASPPARAPCLVGRAYLYGLMAGGERGVQRVHDILRAEVRHTMQLLGVTRVADLGPEHVRLRAG